MLYFLKGIFIGLLFGIPVGAVGALKIRRILPMAEWPAFFPALGAVLLYKYWTFQKQCCILRVSK